MTATRIRSTESQPFFTPVPEPGSFAKGMGEIVARHWDPTGQIGAEWRQLRLDHAVRETLENHRGVLPEIAARVAEASGLEAVSEHPFSP